MKTTARRVLTMTIGAAAVAAVLVSGSLAFGVSRFEQDPSRLARLIARAGGLPEDAVTLDVFDVHAGGWRFTAERLVIDPPGEHAARVEIGRLAGRLPDPREWSAGEVHLGDVVVEGLLVTSATQRPPRPLEPAEGRPVALTARSVTVLDGRYRAAADDPLPAVELDGVAGSVFDLRWVPARRHVEGRAALTAERMAIGAIELAAVSAPELEARGTTLTLGDVTFRYGDTEGQAAGEVTRLDGRAATELAVRVDGERLELAVETATGRPSPIRGRMSAAVTLRSGGDLPRGGATFEGWAEVSGARVRGVDEPSLGLRTLVALAPWFRMEDGWVDVGHVEGTAVFGRGFVRLESLERPSAEHRVLQAWGKLVDGEVDLRIRAVPRRAGSDRDGIGVVISGPSDHPRVRLAGGSDLDEAPAVRVAGPRDRG